MPNTDDMELGSRDDGGCRCTRNVGYYEAKFIDLIVYILRRGGFRRIQILLILKYTFKIELWYLHKNKLFNCSDKVK